jgi:amino acid permease
MGALAVGIMCPSRDPAYLEAVNNGEPGAGSSPWVFGIRKLGIKTFLPDAINFMILSQDCLVATHSCTRQAGLYTLWRRTARHQEFFSSVRREVFHMLLVSVGLPDFLFIL